MQQLHSIDEDSFVNWTDLSTQRPRRNARGPKEDAFEDPPDADDDERRFRAFLRELAVQKSSQLGQMLFDFAKICESGEGVRADKARAWRLYEESEQAGYEKAGEYLDRQCLERSSLALASENFDHVTERLKRLAKEGDTEAPYTLALYYEHNMREPDLVSACDWYLEAAIKHTCTRAGKRLQLRWDQLHECNAGRVFNFRVEYVERDFYAKNSSEHMYWLAYCYEHGKGTPQDLKKAWEWYRRSCRACPDSRSRLGFDWDRLHEANAKEAYELKVSMCTKKSWHRRYPDGLPRFMRSLAECYERGRGTEKDLGKAWFWYHGAAEHGSWTAEKFLDAEWDALHEANPEAAFEWKLRNSCSESLLVRSDFSQHARKRLGCLNYGLGQCCEHGRGTSTNLTQAWLYYETAVNYDNRQAVRLLDNEWSSIHNHDPARAFRWKRDRVMAKQDPSAKLLYSLAECYSLGRGTLPDRRSAWHYYRRAALLGHKEAIQVLSRPSIHHLYYLLAEKTDYTKIAEIVTVHLVCYTSFIVWRTLFASVDGLDLENLRPAEAVACAYEAVATFTTAVLLWWFDVSYL